MCLVTRVYWTFSVHHGNIRNVNGFSCNTTATVTGYVLTPNALTPFTKIYIIVYDLPYKSKKRTTVCTFKNCKRDWGWRLFPSKISTDCQFQLYYQCCQRMGGRVFRLVNMIYSWLTLSIYTNSGSVIYDLHILMTKTAYKSSNMYQTTFKHWQQLSVGPPNIRVIRSSRQCIIQVTYILNVYLYK